MRHACRSLAGPQQRERGPHSDQTISAKQAPIHTTGAKRAPRSGPGTKHRRNRRNRRRGAPREKPAIVIRVTERSPRLLAEALRESLSGDEIKELVQALKG
ncbi:hypothetical protein GCM10009754_70180 [Amycolatopsis minnesotensis]|uniref:Uncharacterized protein n=1 Tax=Amycolatopsis minnesotensis TaxID=337894 RepID=A0ABN2SA51_9PSEU